MSATPTASRWLNPWLLLLVLVLVAGLGASAIALERPVGAASGQVLAKTGDQALGNAEVTVSGPVTRSLLTRPDGSYRFENLPVGSYYISARRKGYSAQFYDGGITVTEGKADENVDFALEQIQPDLEVASYQRVFLPDHPAQVNLRGTQLASLDFTLYRLDLGRAIARRADLAALRTPTIDRLVRAGLLTSLKHWSLPVPTDQIGDDDWFYKPVQMPDLGRGAYLIAMHGQKLKGASAANDGALDRTFWYTVSTLGVVTKRGPNTTLAYAVDLQTKQPAPNVALRLLGGDGLVAHGTTDADGLARFSNLGDAGPLVVFGEQGGSLAVSQASFDAEQAPYKIYGYTDRPVYRPGQRVFLKAIARAQSERTYSPAGGKTVHLVVHDPAGTALLDRSFTLSGTGAFDTAIDLPESAALGDYSAELSIDKDSDQSVGFKVADYRKPEFKIDVHPAKARYDVGETASVTLDARYYFGAPVPGAKLQVTVYSAPAFTAIDAGDAFFTGFEPDGNLEPIWGFGDVVQQSEAVADAQGHFTLQVPTKPSDKSDEQAASDQTYTVTVEGMDQSHRPIKARGAFLVSQGDFRLEADSDQSLYAGPAAMRLTVKASDYDDRPVATALQVRIDRLEQVQKKDAQGDEFSETKRTQVYSGQANTDARGTAHVATPPLSLGSYEATVTAHDAAGRAIVAKTWAWVSGEAAEGESYRYGALQLIFDKKRYKPGDQAKVLVVSPVANLPVLLTIEGVTLGQAQVVRLKGTAGLVTIPVTDAFKPNAFVSACAVNGKEFLTSERSLNVLPEDQFLQVSIHSDKQRYEPGDKATYTIETRDANGKPVSADVSLGVVDEAIYAIEPDQTPDIREYFHGPRWNSIHTSYSFSEDYSGGLDKNAPDPRVRAKFEDTAAWFPALTTGADGRTSVTVTLPDNLTSWVATARAITPNTRVGSAVQSVVATKDLLVRLETPRFVVDGDQVVISAITHNYTDRPQPVDLTLDLKGLALDQPAARHVEIKPQDAAEVTWQAHMVGTGLVTARVVARGATTGDAMELSFPAEPYGDEAVSAISGSASEGVPGRGTLNLPRSFYPGTLRGSLQLGNSPLATVHGAIAYLNDYPWGCTEQTTSRLIGEAVLPARLAALGQPDDQPAAERDRLSRDLLARLLSLQHGDGGWGWFAHDESQVPLTAYALGHLAELRGTPYAPPGDAIKRAEAFLDRALPGIGRDAVARDWITHGGGPDERAEALLALANWGQAPEKELDRLWHDRAGLSPFGQSAYTLALARMHDRRASDALGELGRVAAVSATTANWSPHAEPFAWEDDGVTATAQALEAYLAIDSADPLAAKATRWLIRQSRGGHWQATKDTTAAALALTRELAAQTPHQAGPVSVDVALNQQPIASAVVTPGSDAAPLALPAGQLKPGDNTLEVRAAGGTLDWSAMTRVISHPTGAISAAPGSGLAITRTYYALPATIAAIANGKGELADYYNDKVVSQLKPLGEQVKAGERILVRVSVQADRAMRYLAMRDPLPAGCEVLDDQPENWTFWWDAQEFRDDQAVFFFEQLPAGAHDLYYVMRPTVAGTYRVLPPTVWGMYVPEVRAHGQSGTLTITE